MRLIYLIDSLLHTLYIDEFIYDIYGWCTHLFVSALEKYNFFFLVYYSYVFSYNKLPFFLYGFTSFEMDQPTFLI